MTPGKLSLWGLATIVLGFAIFFVSMGSKVAMIGVAVFVVGLLLLSGAALSKIIQIGVKSSTDRN